MALPLPEEPKSSKQQKQEQIERDARRIVNRQNEQLEKMLQRFSIKDWDLLLVGDGSGSNWNYQCGWGCVSVDRLTMKRQAWYGCMNLGTVNFAEIMAYIQPLICYAAQLEDRRKKYGTKYRVQQIHIITDSDYCKNQGKSNDMSPKRNGSLWRIFDDFQRQGMLLNWHWAPRNDVGLNIFADALSKAARTLLKSNDLQEAVEHDGFLEVQKTIYDVNPSLKKALQ